MVNKNFILKSGILALLLVSGCFQKLSMRFTEKWKGDAVETWKNSKTTFTYEDFDQDQMGKYFVVMIRGKLPLGKTNVKAIKIKDNGERVTAMIYPDKNRK